MTPRWTNYFMGVARLTASLSKANRLKVGCVAVKDKRIVGCGFNGLPEGIDGLCEDAEGQTRPDVNHAEQNLILFCAKNGIPLKDSTVVISHSPCVTCARMLYASGVASVLYGEHYRDTDGIELLKTLGVEVIHAKI